MRVARLFGFDPMVVFLSHSTFGNQFQEYKNVRDAIELLKNEKVDFDLMRNAARCSIKSNL